MKRKHTLIRMINTKPFAKSAIFTYHRGVLFIINKHRCWLSSAVLCLAVGSLRLSVAWIFCITLGTFWKLGLNQHKSVTKFTSLPWIHVACWFKCVRFVSSFIVEHQVFFHLISNRRIFNSYNRMEVDSESILFNSLRFSSHALHAA